MQAASNICWQCRTYFRRYGTGKLKQIVGITVQRHDHQSVHNPVRGELQPRELCEDRVQSWRDAQIARLPQPILQILLPRAPECLFWRAKMDYINAFRARNRLVLTSLPMLYMPFHSEEAFHPLPRTPQEGFRSGLSLQASTVNEAGIPTSSSEED